MSFLLEGLHDLFVQKDAGSRDKLGAYPERIHVRALPERRYLKTARVLTLATIMSLLLNVALAFILMYVSPRMTTEIVSGERSQIYQADKFFKEIKAVPGRTTSINGIRLAVEAEMVRFVRELFTVLPNEYDMKYKWNPSNFLYLAGGTSNQASLAAIKDDAFRYWSKGINTEVWIHASHYTSITGMYEIIFDVFFLNNSDGLWRVCPCVFQNEACATCLGAEAYAVERYKIAIQPWMQSVKNPRNPYGLKLTNWSVFRLPIYDSSNPDEKAEAEWADVRLVR
ncbi:MAG: hypothetical protein ILP11_00740 [Alphaproteobacteria bacterium]|nr:hypothetical protein [Alphaproteobacteria bacterium]